MAKVEMVGDDAITPLLKKREERTQRSSTGELLENRVGSIWVDTCFEEALRLDRKFSDEESAWVPWKFIYMQTIRVSIDVLVDLRRFGQDVRSTSPMSAQNCGSFSPAGPACSSWA